LQYCNLLSCHWVLQPTNPRNIALWSHLLISCDVSDVHGLLVEAKGVEMNLEFSEASVLQMALQHQQKSLLRR